jgi:hypothetical protein
VRCGTGRASPHGGGARLHFEESFESKRGNPEERVTGIEPALSAWETGMNTLPVLRPPLAERWPMTCGHTGWLHAECTLGPVVHLWAGSARRVVARAVHRWSTMCGRSPPTLPSGPFGRFVRPQPSDRLGLASRPSSVAARGRPRVSQTRQTTGTCW